MPSRLPGLALLGVLTVAGAGALAQAEAERRLDAAVERLRAALGPEARITIGGRQVDPVTGRAVLTDVVVAEGARRLAIPELVVEELTETRLGRAEARRATFRDGSGSGEVARVLVAGLPIPVAGKSLDLGNLSFTALEIEAARMEEPGRGSLSLERLELRDWQPQGIGAGQVVAFDYERTGAEAQLLRLGRAEIEQVSLPIAAGAFAPQAFRAARILLEGAAMRDAAQDVRLSLGRVALQDWIPGRPTSLAMEALDLASPAGTYGRLEARLARLEGAGIDAARTLAAIQAGVQVPDPAPGLPQRLALEGLETSFEGQPLLALARIVSEATLRDGILAGGMAIEGFRLTPPRGQADWLEALGYREIEGGLELRGTAPRAGGRLEIAPLRIGWDQAATLTLAAQLDGMPAAVPEGAPMDPARTAEQLAASRLAGLTLSWRDQGLLGRVIGQQAREQRIPEARLREQWAQMALAMPVPGAAPPAQPNRRGAPPAQGKGQAAAPDAFAPIRQAVAAFIRQPGTLEVTLNPPKPIALADFSSFAGDPPAQTVQRLGLSVVAR
jgi:hypothetical protein